VPRSLAAALVLVLALSACYRDASNLSASGEGLPQVAVEFPETSAPGSVHTAALEIVNPGPGDIERLAVSFALVGAPAAQGLPVTLVGAAGGGRRDTVLGVSPRPMSVSPDGVVYRFEGLAEGESVTIEFELRVPDTPGVAANSVIVSDDSDPSRARGARLETTVEQRGTASAGPAEDAAMRVA
jgi:hypothetical protein